MKEKIKRLLKKSFDALSTKERKEKIANYALNMNVACMAVALFQPNKVWAILPAILSLYVFWIFTRNEGE